MKKYADYTFNYKGLKIIYYIGVDKFYPRKYKKMVNARVRKNDKTILRMRIPLSMDTKLNKELQSVIEKYVIANCEEKLKEELL